MRKAVERFRTEYKAPLRNALTSFLSDQDWDAAPRQRSALSPSAPHGRGGHRGHSKKLLGIPR